MKRERGISPVITKEPFSVAIILLYHRIIDLNFDPYRIIVNPKKFFIQMKYLKKNIK
jgi:hypothetical protein